MAQLLEQQTLPAKLIESGTGGCAAGDLVIEVDVEDVLPRLAVYRPGLYLAQVGVVFGKYLEGRDQGSRAVSDRKGDADFIRIGNRPDVAATTNQEKTSVVGGIVFDARGKHVSPIGQGGLLAGDGACLPVSQTGNVLDTARSVVKRGGCPSSDVR